MKNKKLTYVLVPAVIGIWGLIAYKIIDYGGEDEVPVGTAIAGPVTEIGIQSDTFSLATNYSDPFLDRTLKKQARYGVEDVAPSAAPVQPKASNRAVVQPTAIRWPEVSCSGRIKSRDSGSKSVIMNVDGLEILMQEGEVRSSIKLLAIGKDSVRVAYMEEERALAVN